mmetsp:Transcript_2064/g.6010  ORF Transcript_2064/g.6010 Transcript_2064/m.6010 type:complete len:310 (-) Transcript_2064:260-1189(-)
MVAEHALDDRLRRVCGLGEPIHLLGAGHLLQPRDHRSVVFADSVPELLVVLGLLSALQRAVRLCCCEALEGHEVFVLVELGLDRRLPGAPLRVERILEPGRRHGRKAEPAHRLADGGAVVLDVVRRLRGRGGQLRGAVGAVNGPRRLRGHGAGGCCPRGMGGVGLARGHPPGLRRGLPVLLQHLGASLHHELQRLGDRRHVALLLHLRHHRRPRLLCLAVPRGVPDDGRQAAAVDIRRDGHLDDASRHVVLAPPPPWRPFETGDAAAPSARSHAALPHRPDPPCWRLGAGLERAPHVVLRPSGARSLGC